MKHKYQIKNKDLFMVYIKSDIKKKDKEYERCKEKETARQRKISDIRKRLHISTTR